MTQDEIKYTVLDTPIKPDYSVTFGRPTDKQQIGRLDFNGEKMTFEGEAEESAKIFFDYLAGCFHKRLEEERSKEREACAQICDKLNELWPDEGGTPGCCAADIRARGEK